ncbi:hypothetical protein J3F83DRAFT_297471 [Trichoderma novae-zelandiae]
MPNKQNHTVPKPARSRWRPRLPSHASICPRLRSVPKAKCSTQSVRLLLPYGTKQLLALAVADPRSEHLVESVAIGRQEETCFGGAPAQSVAGICFVSSVLLCGSIMRIDSPLPCRTACSLAYIAPWPLPTWIGPMLALSALCVMLHVRLKPKQNSSSSIHLIASAAPPLLPLRPLLCCLPCLPPSLPSPMLSPAFEPLCYSLDSWCYPRART